jgi:hypothetical protein
VICAVVQLSWQDVPIEPCATEADEDVVAAIDAPLAPGTIQVVWQLAAVELHLIMQFVTVEVTVLVSGVMGCDCSCAKAAPDRMTDNNAAETADATAPRRMMFSLALPAAIIIAHRK